LIHSPSTKHLTTRCSEPRARLRLTFSVLAIHRLAAWSALPGSRSLILHLVRPEPAFIVVKRIGASSARELECRRGIRTADFWKEPAPPKGDSLLEAPRLIRKKAKPLRKKPATRCTRCYRPLSIDWIRVTLARSY